MSDPPDSATCEHAVVLALRFDEPAHETFGRIALWACQSCRLRFDPRLATPPAPTEDGQGSGTTTDCTQEGVHDHPFRGPHRFTEWYPIPAPTEDATLDEPDPNRTGMPKCPCGDIAYQPDSYTGRRQAWRCGGCHRTLSKCDCAAGRATPPARGSAPITESALTGLLVRDCQCKDVHDHWKPVGDGL